ESVRVLVVHPRDHRGPCHEGHEQDQRLPERDEEQALAQSQLVHVGPPAPRTARRSPSATNPPSVLEIPAAGTPVALLDQNPDRRTPARHHTTRRHRTAHAAAPLPEAPSTVRSRP